MLADQQALEAVRKMAINYGRSRSEVRAVNFRMTCISALPRCITGRSRLVPSVYTCLVFVQSLGGCSAIERVNSRKVRVKKSRLARPLIIAYNWTQQIKLHKRCTFRGRCSVHFGSMHVL
jgi:hypothetical protein